MLLLNVLVVLALFLAAFAPSVVGDEEDQCKKDRDCHPLNFDYCYAGKCKTDPPADYYEDF